MAHIILCGDSIFDNASYVKQGEADVTKQVASLLPTGSEVSRLAIDGDVTDGISKQLIRLPSEASHIFISVGGNDALGYLDIFSKEINTVGEAFFLLSERRTVFEKQYHAMLEIALSFALPLTVCSIYYPRFHANIGLERVSELFNINGERMQEMVMGALAVYNDIITKEAFQAGIPLIDLRVLCNEAEDFANPIEPSEKGGQKIANLIKEITFSHDFSQKESIVYC